MTMTLEPGAYRALLLTSGVGVLLLAACAVRPPSAPGPDTVFVVDERIAAPAPTPLDPVSVGADALSERLYVPWEAPGAGPVALRVERGPIADADERFPGASASWQIRRFLVGADGGQTPHSQDDFIIDAAGSLALAESVDFAESAVVVFDPPLTVLPAGLSPGESYSQQTYMRVYRMQQDQRRPRAEGEVSQQVEYVGDERIRTPAAGDEGEVLWDARRIRSAFTVQLGPAQVRNQLDQWFVDGLGLVSEQRHEQTSALGVPFRNNLERWALLSDSTLGAGVELAAALRRPGTPARALPAPGSPAADAAPPSSPPAADTQRPWTSPTRRRAR